MKPVYFTPRDFGGYTFFLLVSGVFLGNTSLNISITNIVIGLLSIVSFFIAMKFYSISNND